MIVYSDDFQAALYSQTNRPLDLYELYLDSGTYYFSTETITWGGHTYQGQAVSRGPIKKYIDQQFDNVSVTLSNVDTTVAQLILGQDIEGRIMIIRRIDRTVTDDSHILFWGQLEKPNAIDEDTCQLDAMEFLGGIDRDAPGRTFTVQCPWEFRSPECTYSGAGASCDKSWAQCSNYRNTHNFGGFLFIPISGSYQYKQSGRGSKTMTTSWSSIDSTPYDVPIPIVYGRGYLPGIVIQYADVGTVQNSLVAFCIGEISDMICVQSNQKNVAAYYNHLGEPGGTGTQTVDGRFPSGYPYTLLAYIGVVLREDPANPASTPDVVATILGRKVQLADSGAFDVVGWTDNPVLNLRDYFLLSRRQGGLGIPQSFLNDVVNNETQAYCNETVSDTTNDQVIYLPSSLPTGTVVGVDYRRFQSTGVIGADPETDGPYFDYDSTSDTSITPAAVDIKRFTMNVAISETQAAVDLIWQKLLPTFRGYINYDKYGKICIRAEQAVPNTTLSAGSSVGNTSISFAAMPFAVGNLVLLSPLTANAETLKVQSISGNTATFATAAAYAHGSGDGAWQVVYAFNDSNICGKSKYPLSTDRQSATNRITASYVDAPNGFEKRSIIVDDEENQQKTYKINNEDLDLSGCDSFFQAYRIAQWKLVKYRQLGKFIEIPGNITASQLETGDVFAATLAEFGLQAVPFMVVEINYLENDECTVVGQLYDVGVYDDVAPQVTATVPGRFPTSTLLSPVTPVTVVSAALSFDANGNPVPSLVYTPPVDPNFVGVHIWAEEPDQSGSTNQPFQLDVSHMDSAAPVASARVDLGKFKLGTLDAAGHYTLVLPAQTPVTANQVWRFYLCSYGAVYDNPLVPATDVSPSPNLTLTVTPGPNGGLGQEWAPNVSSLVCSVQTRYTNNSYQYRVLLSWQDPNPALFPATYGHYAGVQVHLVPLQDLTTGVPLTLPPITATVPQTAASWSSPWTDLPLDQDLFQVYALSIDQQGRRNTYSMGVTPETQFTTPLVSPTSGPAALADVTGFGVTCGYGYANDGSFDFICDPSFTVPADPAFANINLICERPTGSGNYIALGSPSIGDGLAYGDKAILPKPQFPQAVENWDFVAVSVDTNGRPKYPSTGPFGTSPRVTVAVAPQAAALGTGTEYAPLVTGVSAAIITGLNGDGGEIYAITFEWTNPTGDPRYQGLTPVAIYAGGYTVPLGQLGPNDTSATSSWSTLQPTTLTLYFLSHDGSGRTNSIQAGITPAVGLTVSLQTTGSLLGNRLKASSLGQGLGVSGGQLVVPNQGITTSLLAYGAVASYAQFANSLRPIEIVSSLPSLPSSSYPAGAAVVLTSDYQLYRSNGSTWTTAVPGSSIVADSAFITKVQAVSVTAVAVVSSWVYTGTLVASQVVSGSFSGVSLSLSANGVTTNVTNASDPTSGAGISVTDNTTSNYSATTQFGFRLYTAAGSIWAAMDGTPAFPRVYLSDGSNLVVLKPSTGLNFPTTNTVYGPAGVVIGGSSGASASVSGAVLSGIALSGGIVTGVTSWTVGQGLAATGGGLFIPNGGITASLLANGAVDSYSTFANSLRPLETVSSLPALPSSSYPAGAAVVLTSDYQLYRSNGSTWTTAVPGSSIVADSAFITKVQAVSVTAVAVVSSWVYTGTLVASQVVSGSFSGVSLSLSANGVTTNITNNSDPTSGAGISVTDNTTSNYSATTQFGFRLYTAAGSIWAAVDGTTSAPRVYLNDGSVSVVLKPSTGLDFPSTGTYYGPSGITISGTAGLTASVSGSVVTGITTSGGVVTSISSSASPSLTSVSFGSWGAIDSGPSFPRVYLNDGSVSVVLKPSTGLNFPSTGTYYGPSAITIGGTAGLTASVSGSVVTGFTTSGGVVTSISSSASPSLTSVSFGSWGSIDSGPTYPRLYLSGTYGSVIVNTSQGLYFPSAGTYHDAAGVVVSGYRVVGSRQAGPGAVGSGASLATLIAAFNSLYSALQSFGCVS